MRKALGIAGIVYLTCASGAEAQADFAAVKLKPGDVIYVTTPSGAELSGRLGRLSPTTLSIDGYDFKPEAGLKVEKRGDPLWDGTAIGLLAGLAIGAFTAADECGTEWSLAQCALAGAGWGSLLGLVIDWQHSGRTLVYSGASSTSQPEMRSVVPRTPQLSIRVGF